MSLWKIGSLKARRRKRRVLKRPRCRLKYTTIMTRAATISTATCQEEGDTAKTSAETGLLLRGETNRPIEGTIIGRTKKL